MDKRKVKKNKGLAIIGSLFLVSALSVAMFSGFWYAAVKKSDVINNGVYVENIKLGGKKLSDAKALLQEKFQFPMTSKKIKIIFSHKTYELEYNKLHAGYNIDEVVKKATNYGKQGSILERYKNKYFGKRKDFKLALSYNTKPIDEFIDSIEKEINKNPVNAKLSINNGEIEIIPEVDGVKLQRDKLKQNIITKINSEPFEGNPEITTLLETFKPRVTSEKLSLINALISTFSTNFSSSIPNRIGNIELATSAISGTLLMPGEIFSFNNTVGERTRERGYREAGVIIGDKMETGFGGGVCQVSSTLYNTVLTANLKILERTKHSLPSAYIAKGLDATVDWGIIDLKFKNTLNVPIYINGYTKNKNLYFDIYSNKELTKRNYKMATDVYEEIQPNIKFIDDPNLDAGKTQVIKTGSAGYKVKTYRNTFENGKFISTELISSDYYIPVDEEVAKGMKIVTYN